MDDGDQYFKKNYVQKIFIMPCVDFNIWMTSNNVIMTSWM